MDNPQNREYCDSYLTHLIYPQLAIGVGSLGPSAVGHQAVSKCHYLLLNVSRYLKMTVIDDNLVFLVFDDNLVFFRFLKDPDQS